ncbi:MAG TPA: hypothetical protein VN372_03770 [Methanospirillum sp.]|nr:hypothetical protein [Methanospirillum sp.]
MPAFKLGDLVTIAEGDTVTLLPLNDVYPLHNAITSIGASGEPTVYIPYRVYPGDTVLMKMTDSGYALIPEEISGKGILSGADVVNASTGEIYCPESVTGCNGYYYDTSDRYGLHPHYTSACPGFTGNPPVPEDSVNIRFLGWNVRGYTAYGVLAISSRLAYEFVDVTVSGRFGLPGDTIFPHVSMGLPYPFHWRWLNASTIRIEAYPGYGGNFGMPAQSGGYGYIVFGVQIGGGINNVRVEYNPGYLSTSRSVYVTLAQTGRYGNYQ